jgi:hypothetical protein
MTLNSGKYTISIRDRTATWLPDRTGGMAYSGPIGILHPGMSGGEGRLHRHAASKAWK